VSVSLPQLPGPAAAVAHRPLPEVLADDRGGTGPETLWASISGPTIRSNRSGGPHQQHPGGSPYAWHDRAREHQDRLPPPSPLVMQRALPRTGTSANSTTHLGGIGMTQNTQVSPGADEFDLNVELVEVADPAGLVNITNDGCGSTCGACTTGVH